jgi:queuine tRNA-ribosyltransferase
MTETQGNRYTLEVLDNGVVSFRHTQTGEILHGSVGPEKEATELYIDASGLGKCGKSEVVVFDVGTGCGAQLMALIDFLKTSQSVQEIHVYSFDLEKEGLRAALEAREQFASVERNHLFLEKSLSENSFTWKCGENKNFHWKFIGGDFRETIRSLRDKEPQLKADFIFYDFFSPASHPWLWTFELFQMLHSYCKETTHLVTYSSATCVKAALVAAGWFVGTTIPSGKKAQSIFAAGSRGEVANLLPSKFISTFSLSHKPFCDAETQESQLEIRKRLLAHPQFSEG